MDKYLIIILIFMMVSIPISFISPTTGEIREEPFILLFYGAIAGICIIVVYSARKERQERRRINRSRRTKR